ncbi:MAG: hypothetical protein ACKO21_15980 [Nodosilinea sp.]
MADDARPPIEKPKKKIPDGRHEGGSDRRKGRGSRRGEEDRKPAVPPALMRGPKPGAKKVALEEEPLAETEVATPPTPEAVVETEVAAPPTPEAVAETEVATTPEPEEA